jgi:hypothetical protein
MMVPIAAAELRTTSNEPRVTVTWHEMSLVC